MSVTPKSMWPAVKVLLHSVHDQPDAASAEAQFDRLLDYTSEELPAVVEELEQARADVLRSPSSPKMCGRRPGPSIPQNG